MQLFSTRILLHKLSSKMGSDAVFLKMEESANFQKLLLKRFLKIAQNPWKNYPDWTSWLSFFSKLPNFYQSPPDSGNFQLQNNRPTCLLAWLEHLNQNNIPICALKSCGRNHSAMHKNCSDASIKKTFIATLLKYIFQSEAFALTATSFLCICSSYT